jgi:hypothetical protein
MICKGTTHNNGAKLAAYMTTGKRGERAELWQLRGFEATGIKDAFRDIQIMAGATKCEQPFFHVQVRNREGEKLTRQQWEATADRIEQMLGLTGQPRAISFHTYDHNGDEHMHVAWSRINENTLTAVPLPFFKQRLKKISRELEMEFALQPVTNRREGNIKFAPTRAEQEQARRLGLDIHEVRNVIRNCWDRSDCGSSFQAALEHEGLSLAKGERRDFVVIDHAGGIHALGKRILDVTATQARNRMADLSRDDLPTVEMARALLPERAQERASEHTKQKERPEPVWDRERDDRVWQDAVINAAIEKEKVERLFVEPRNRETRAGGRLDGGGSKEREWPVMPPKPEPIKTSPQYHFEDAARETVRPTREARSEWAELRVERSRAAFPERAANTQAHARTIASNNIKRSAKTGKAAARTIGKALGSVGSAVESLFAPKLTPAQIRAGEKAAHLREAEAESNIDFSRYTAEIAHRRQQQENEWENQRRRERDGGGRER